jgi:hypothetical protein
MGMFSPSDLEPRSMRNAEVRARRHAALTRRPAHMAPLLDYTDRLREQRPLWYVPDFDPAGGGIESHVVFLFEKPGPKTDGNKGSGLLSVCNDDPTAAATHGFIARNQLTLDRCIFANVIPWWDGTRKISSEQRSLAGQAIADLVILLPALRAVVLVGGTAQRSWDRIGLQAPPDVRVWRSDHPGPLVRARYPDRWNKIPDHWPTSASLPCV